MSSGLLKMIRIIYAGYCSVCGTRRKQRYCIVTDKHYSIMAVIR